MMRRRSTTGSRDSAAGRASSLLRGPALARKDGMREGISRRAFIGLSAVVPFIPRSLIEGPPPRPVEPVEHYQYLLKRFAIQDFLPIIVDECQRQQAVFPLEPEVEVAKLRQESLFRPDAISLAGAVGIAQFIPTTAQERFGMTVYVTKDYTDGVDFQKQFLAETRLVDAALRENTFKLVQQHKLQADKLGKLAAENFLRYKQDLEARIANASQAERAALDQRFDPDLCIRNGVRYLAEMCRACADRFKGPDRHNILRGLAAYNAGLDQVFKFDGIPFIFQTVDYVRKIMTIYDQLIEAKGAVTSDQ